MPSRRDTQSTEWKEEITIKNAMTSTRCEKEKTETVSTALGNGGVIAQIPSDDILIIPCGKQRICTSASVSANKLLITLRHATEARCHISHTFRRH